MRSDIISFRIFIGIFAVHNFVDHKIVDHNFVNRFFIISPPASTPPKRQPSCRSWGNVLRQTAAFWLARGLSLCPLAE